MVSVQGLLIISLLLSFSASILKIKQYNYSAVFLALSYIIYSLSKNLSKKNKKLDFYMDISRIMLLSIAGFGIALTLDNFVLGFVFPLIIFNEFITIHTKASYIKLKKNPKPDFGLIKKEWHMIILLILYMWQIPTNIVYIYLSAIVFDTFYRMVTGYRRML